MHISNISLIFSAPKKQKQKKEMMMVNTPLLSIIVAKAMYL